VYTIGISTIANAIAKPHAIVLIMLVTPVKLENIAPAPISRKML